MKKIKALLYAVLLFLAFPATAQLNIIHTIPSPAAVLTLDLAYDGEYIWVSGGQSGGILEDSIYQISKIDGTVIKTLPKDPQANATGLVFVNGYLWMADAVENMIHKIDTADGTIVFSFPSPANLYSSGMAWDGETLWAADAISGIFYQIDTLGNTLSQSTPPVDGFTSGLTIIDGHFWYTNNSTDQLIEMDLSDFSILQEFEITEGIYTNGLTFDGQYLWLAVADNDDSTVDSIYQIDFGLPSAIDDFESHVTTINAYPNPATNTLYLDLINVDTYQPSFLSIRDALGKLLIRTDQVNSKNNIDITNLPSGIYVYIFEQPGGATISGKFVKK